MDSSKKITKLKNITFKEFAELVKTLFKNLDYFELESKNERCITGLIKTGITTSTAYRLFPKYKD